MKYIMTDNVVVGDEIICGGYIERVIEVVEHKPNEHNDSPIRNDLVAVEYVTEHGSRWKGLM